MLKKKYRKMNQRKPPNLKVLLKKEPPIANTEQYVPLLPHKPAKHKYKPVPRYGYSHVLKTEPEPTCFSS